MMHNRETAHHFGVAPTGNGFGDLGRRRLVRMRNTYFAPRPGPHWVDHLEALAADVRLGLVLHGSLGGAVTRLGMSSSTQYGRLVRDGRLTGDWIGPANFTAETAGCLQTVRGFAGSLSAAGVGFCGKSGQTRRVTDGGPAWVKLGCSPALHLAFEG
jgi:TldD protein